MLSLSSFSSCSLSFLLLLLLLLLASSLPPHPLETKHSCVCVTTTPTLTSTITTTTTTSTITTTTTAILRVNQTSFDDVIPNKVPPADNVPQNLDETTADHDRDNDRPRPQPTGGGRGGGGKAPNGSNGQKYIHQPNRQSLDHQQTRQYPPYTKHYHSKQWQTSLSSGAGPARHLSPPPSTILLASATFSAAVCLLWSLCRR